MIDIFNKLIKDKKLKIDINEYIINYSINFKNLKKDYNHYYDLYSEIDKKIITIPLNDEIISYEKKVPELYDFKNKTDQINSFFMKYCLLESIKNVIDEKYKKDKNIKSEIKKYKNKFNHYPDINDYEDYEDYLKEISLRKEFCIHHIPKNKNTKNKSSFELEPHQLFLKNLLSNNTPYKSLLIFHGVGVGKTCSGVSIAENFKTNNNKTIILAPEKIQLGWRKNINDPFKGKNQCTGDEYNYEEDKYEINKEKSANQKINENYEMFGYLSFSNSVKNYLNENLKGIPKKEIILKKQREIELIKEKYSNLVLIIDEVHNIRNNSKKSDTSLYIEKVIRYSNNLRLILLTANPMFNQPEEIIWILNMLLINDKKREIKNDVIFDENNILTKETEEFIRENSKGYISYLRGENPITFPYRLYPSENILDNSSKRDLFDEDIIEDDKISFLKLYESKLKGKQLEIYKKGSLNLKSKKIDEESELIHISNIVYPNESEKTNDIYGETGFNNCFKKVKNQYEYKKDIPDFLELNNLNNYSSKIKSIIDSINKSDGIVFIYSNWLYSGILPIVLALERNGYQKYDNKSILNEQKSDPISYDGKRGKTQIPAKFMVIAGDSLKLTSNFKDELKIATHEDNKHGELIKVIIGSSVAAEGLDFKNIRNIHLLEPWHNINKLEQVIGRGIRNYSHFMLEPKYRNITIYLHSVSYKDKESIESYLYRRCEKKAKQIGQIEVILKETAIDKYLFQNANLLDEKNLEDIVIKPSLRNSEEYTLKPIDLPYSRTCSFLEDCNYIKNDSFKINSKTKHELSTFSIDYSQSLIDIYKNKISDIIIIYYYISLEDLIEILNKDIINLIDELLYHAIDQMINDKYEIKTNNNMIGYFKTTDNYYYFQPFDNNDIYMPLYYKLNNGIIDKNEYQIVGKDINTLSLPEFIEYDKKEIEKLFDEIIESKFSSKEEEILELKNKQNNQFFEDKILLSYKIDRLRFKQRSILLYSLLMHVQEDDKFEKKYNKLLSDLLDIFQSLFIYINSVKFEWYNKYDKSNKSKLFGGFLYYHERKKYIFYRYDSKKLILCNKIQESNIITSLSLIPKRNIFSKNSYGYIEYNKNYKLIQNGLVLKIKRNKDLRGNIFISSSTTEWTSSSGIKFIKSNYSDDWKNINQKYIDILEEKDHNDKNKINKLKLAVLIELLMRKNNNLIGGDIYWLFKY